MIRFPSGRMEQAFYMVHGKVDEADIESLSTPDMVRVLNATAFSAIQSLEDIKYWADRGLLYNWLGRSRPDGYYRRIHSVKWCHYKDEGWPMV